MHHFQSPKPKQIRTIHTHRYIQKAILALRTQINYVLKYYGFNIEAVDGYLRVEIERDNYILLQPQVHQLGQSLSE